jgi:hypothetical protein
MKLVLRSLPEAKLLESSNDPNKLPIGHLYGATSQFIFGFFEGTILNASFAIEYGLLLKLNEILTLEEKQEIAAKRNGLGLVEAIKRSNGILIDEKLAQELHIIKNLRDMSAHPSNWITLYNDINKMFLDEKTVQYWITKVTNQSSKSIAQRLGDEFDRDNALKAVKNMRSFKDERWGNLLI